MADQATEEFVVLHAPGWPGGYNPVPQTVEAARDFVRRNGGILKRREVTPWEDVDLEATHAE